MSMFFVFVYVGVLNVFVYLLMMLMFYFLRPFQKTSQPFLSNIFAFNTFVDDFVVVCVQCVLRRCIFLWVCVCLCFCVYDIHKNYTHTRRQVETRVWRSRLFINPLSLERRWPISIIRPWTCQPSQSSATSRNFLKNSNKKNPNESRKSPNIKIKNKTKNLTTNK